MLTNRAKAQVTCNVRATVRLKSRHVDMLISQGPVHRKKESERLDAKLQPPTTQPLYLEVIGAI